eukprot:gene260-4014_t
MDPYSISQCSACGKSYSNDANLRKHIRRQPLCAKWNAMKQSGSKSFVDDQMWGEVNKTQTEIDMEIVTEIVCPTCGEKYSNMGNLNRHLNASVVCRKWIVYNDVNGIEQYISKWANPSAMVDPSTSLVDLSTSLVDPSTSLVEEHDKPLSSSSPSPTIAPSPPLLQTVPYGVPFPPPAASEKGMLHIIWNLFLTDRESAGQNLVEMVDSNGVQLIIAMLPDLKHFVADTVDRANFGAVRKDYIDQVLVNVLMMAKPDFFERLRYDPTPTKDSTAGDVFNCDPATNKWVVINRIAIQYYLMKKVVPMADLTTEEVDYLFDNNSAVKDIIERLVCEGKGSGFTIPLINAYIEGVNKAEKDPSKRVIICGAGSSNVVVENNRVTTKRHVYKGIAFKPLHDEIVY